MTDIQRVGIDLAKTVFHHGNEAAQWWSASAFAGRGCILPNPAATGLLGGDGSLWQCSSLGTAGAAGHKVIPTQGGAVHQRQQERRQ